MTKKIIDFTGKAPIRSRYKATPTEREREREMITNRITEIHEKLAANDRLFESLMSYTDHETVSETLWIKDNRRYSIAKTTSDLFWLGGFDATENALAKFTVDDDSIIVEWTNHFDETVSSRYYGIVPNEI